MLANYYLGGGTWQAHGIRAGQVLDKVALIEDGSAALGDFARELVGSAVRQGFLRPGG
jgi:putative hydrolase of HD superfamily